MERLLRMNEALIRADFNKKRAVRIYAELNPQEENLPSRQTFIRYWCYKIFISSDTQVGADPGGHGTDRPPPPSLTRYT